MRLTRAQPVGVPAATREVSQRSVSGSSVLVTAVVGGGATHIADVQPGDGAPVPAGLATGYTLDTINSSGQVIGSTMMTGSAGHTEPVQDDGSGTGAAPIMVLTGEVPAADVSSIAVMSGSTTLATEARPATPPSVKLLAPRAGSRIGTGGQVPIRWTASEPGGATLRAEVDYSADGGTSWRLVYMGPNSGHTTLPARLFGRSGHARVRIRINDGFNTTTTESGPLRSVGAAPVVSIASPMTSQTIDDGTELYLSGEATDDAGHALQGQSLRWYAGKRLIATGPVASAIVFGHGRTPVTLVATDRYGRRSMEKVTIRVKAARAILMTLRAPRRSSAKARHVVLTVASSLPDSRLRIGHHTFTVGLHRRKITVPVKPGRATLHLSLTLTAGGPPSRVVVSITR